MLLKSSIMLFGVALKTNYYAPRTGNILFETEASCVHDHVQDDIYTLFGSHVTGYIGIAQSLRITIDRKRRIL